MLASPERWRKLTFLRHTGVLDTVIDLNPYNSKGTQPFRTLLSAKIGSSRYMRPYNGFLKPLPANPETVLRGFNSITNHPERKHKHTPYTISGHSFDNIHKLTKNSSSDGVAKMTQAAVRENVSENEINIECMGTD